MSDMPDVPEDAADAIDDDVDMDIDMESALDEEPSQEVEEVQEADEDVMLLEEVDEELVLPVWEPTGEARVDEALELLTTLDVDDVHQHSAVYGEIHEKLRATLSSADTPTG